MLEIRIYGQAKCPYCKRLYMKLIQMFTEKGLSPSIVFHEQSSLLKSPLPENAIIVDLTTDEVRDIVDLSMLREMYPITCIDAYTPHGSRITIFVVGSVGDIDKLAEKITTIYGVLLEAMTS